MNIGFDAKRIYKNNSGLGNYSRTLVEGLASQFPENNYHLFTSNVSNLFPYKKFENVYNQLPTKWLDKKFPGWWRRNSMGKDIARLKMDIFHGLSNELPDDIKKISTKKIVTIHDLIFERHPETYHWDEIIVHRLKVKQACTQADAIIATSNQTKNDLIELYLVDENKITTVYQSCDEAFEKTLDEHDKLLIKKKYTLPNDFFLFVGSITQRKNLITICKAMHAICQTTNIPLVVVGNGKKEKEAVKAFLLEKNIQVQVIFLNETNGFVPNSDLPAIYQQAAALIYPSIYEGFGIPILEAFHSNIPVITSNCSSMPEVAGDAALYFDPYDYETLGKLMKEVTTISTREKYSRLGKERVRQFSRTQFCKEVMSVYTSS